MIRSVPQHQTAPHLLPGQSTNPIPPDMPGLFREAAVTPEEHQAVKLLDSGADTLFVDRVGRAYVGSMPGTLVGRESVSETLAKRATVHERYPGQRVDLPLHKCGERCNINCLNWRARQLLLSHFPTGPMDPQPAGVTATDKAS